MTATVRTHPLPALLVLLAAAAPPALAQEDPDPAWGVRPGDRVEIEFFTSIGEPDESIAGSRIVGREGDIFLPLVGTVDVEGLDAEEIRILLVERYGRVFENPVIAVHVELRVNVTGAVRQPGNYFMDPSSTVLDAVSRAGGMGAEVEFGVQVAAAPDRVRLVREGEVRILNLAADDAVESDLEVLIQSGDWIYVPPRARSRWRDTIQFAGSIATLAATVIGIVIFLAD